VTTILLTRHGETAWNLERRYQGHGDSPLTGRGLEQARCLARRLAHEPIYAVYCSDLARARLTAEAVVAGRGLPVVVDPAWRELNYGAWEGLTRQEIDARFSEAWARRLADPAHGAPPGGESRSALQRRAVAALTAVRDRHAGRTVLVVTHSGLLMALGAWLRGVDIGSGNLPSSRHCSLSCVRWSGAEPIVEFWDDVQHVEAAVAP
jgi:broad specificity phosphatase PhoE